VAADWLVGSLYDDGGSDRPGRRPGLPEAMLEVVYLDPESKLYLARVNPDLDRAWRADGH
jgi:hypothetical protein